MAPRTRARTVPGLGYLQDYRDTNPALATYARYAIGEVLAVLRELSAHRGLMRNPIPSPTAREEPTRQLRTDSHRREGLPGGVVQVG